MNLAYVYQVNFFEEIGKDFFSWKGAFIYRTCLTYSQEYFIVQHYASASDLQAI